MRTNFLLHIHRIVPLSDQVSMNAKRLGKVCEIYRFAEKDFVKLCANVLLLLFMAFMGREEYGPIHLIELIWYAILLYFIAYDGWVTYSTVLKNIENSDIEELIQKKRSLAKAVMYWRLFISVMIVALTWISFNLEIAGATVLYGSEPISKIGVITLTVVCYFVMFVILKLGLDFFDKHI